MISDIDGTITSPTQEQLQVTRDSLLIYQLH